MQGEALTYATRIYAMSGVFEQYESFFESIQKTDSSIIPDSMKSAAFQIQFECQEKLAGFSLELAGMLGNIGGDLIQGQLF